MYLQCTYMPYIHVYQNGLIHRLSVGTYYLCLMLYVRKVCPAVSVKGHIRDVKCHTCMSERY